MDLREDERHDIIVLDSVGTLTPEQDAALQAQIRRRKARMHLAVLSSLAGMAPPIFDLMETVESEPAGVNVAKHCYKPAQHFPARAGRNDRCPCGSGIKYKRCCKGGPLKTEGK